MICRKTNAGQKAAHANTDGIKNYIPNTFVLNRDNLIFTIIINLACLSIAR